MLANRLSCRITLVVPQVVPFPLPLSSPPVLLDWNERRFRVIASQSPVETEVQIYLCRDRLEMLEQRAESALPGSDRSAGNDGGLRSGKDIGKKTAACGHEVILDGNGVTHMLDLFYVVIGCRVSARFAGPSPRPATSSRRKDNGLHHCRNRIARTVCLPDLRVAPSGEVLKGTSMTSIGILQIALFFGLILVCAKPLGAYMARVFEGERTFLHPVLRWLEVLTYKVIGVKRRRRAALDPLHGVAAQLQYLRLPADLPARSALQGVLAVESAGFRRRQCSARPGVQHGRQFHDEHELAVVCRRIDDELLRADGGACGPELRVGRGGNRGRGRADTRICAAGEEDDRKLLGRCDAGTVYILLPISIVAALFFVSQGVDSEFQARTRR